MKPEVDLIGGSTVERETSLESSAAVPLLCVSYSTQNRESPESNFYLFVIRTLCWLLLDPPAVGRSADLGFIHMLACCAVGTELLDPFMYVIRGVRLVMMMIPILWYGSLSDVQI